ncbi:YaaR family protein [Virgibacillus ainsalahensis]
MKISHEMQTKQETTYTRPVAADAQTFQKMVQSQTEQLKQQELQQLMKNITIQGDKLARYRTFRELATFKRLVKGFLQETVSNGLDLQKFHSFSMEGRNRNLTIVKKVDEKLIELTEEVMNHEKKTVNILSLIGEVKGLLINIYR